MAEILSLARLLATSCERSKYKGQISQVSNEFSRKPIVIRYFNISNFAAVEIGKKKEGGEEEDIKRRGEGRGGGGERVREDEKGEEREWEGEEEFKVTCWFVSSLISTPLSTRV